MQAAYESGDTMPEGAASVNLDRTMSSIMQQAWRIAREQIRKMPGVAPVTEDPAAMEAR